MYCNMFAPKIAGIESKKEYSATYFLLIPKKLPVKIVESDLEIPGIIEMACAMPIKNEFFAFNNFSLSLNLSIIKQSNPVNISCHAVALTSKNIFSNTSEKKIPKSAAGMLPTKRNQRYFLSESNIVLIFCLKKIITAKVVAKCKTTSNKTPGCVKLGIIFWAMTK